MVYLSTGSSDLIVILGCMAPTFLYLSFSSLYCRSLWTTDTIIFSKLNKPRSQLSPPPPPTSNGFEINKPPNPRGVIEDLRYLHGQEDKRLYDPCKGYAVPGPSLEAGGHGFPPATFIEKKKNNGSKRNP